MEHTLGDEVGWRDKFITIGLNPCFSGTYSRSGSHTDISRTFSPVLILVLVEHTLGGQCTIDEVEKWIKVLILVLVEHTLGAVTKGRITVTGTVLILVLVEHTLGVATLVVPRRTPLVS